MQQYSAKELKDRLDEQEHSAPLLLDVREPWEFEHCRIEGALNIPMNQIPQQLDTLDSARETVVICHHGMRSLQVAQFLSRQGFADVINLSGGIDAWSLEVDPAVPRY